MRFLLSSAVALGLSLGSGVAGQAPPTAPAVPPPAPPKNEQSFPAQQRPLAAPEVIERGKSLYGIHCRMCHGPDLRGGDMGGVNLLRSALVLSDQDGELILPVVTQGRFPQGSPPMPALALPPEDVKAVAAYIHSVAAQGGRQGGPPPGPPVQLKVVVGDASRGRKYFATNCSACHSATGDLAGLAARYPDPLQLQTTWVAGRAALIFGSAGPPTLPGPPRNPPRPVTATITTADGKRVVGRLDKIDDFLVAVVQEDGRRLTFRRDGAIPAIEVNDPLQGHKKLLVQYKDADIHDVTAYLVTLK